MYTSFLYSSALKKNLENSGETNEALAKSLGLSRSYVTETVGFSRLPENIKQTLIENNVTNRSIYRRLLKCNNEVAMQRMLGSEQKSSASKRKRNVFSVFFDEGHCVLKKGKVRLSSNEKEELIKNLENLLLDLKKTFEA